jgi:hypothetical protein
MLASSEPLAPQRIKAPGDRFAYINAVAITGDQLTRAFHVRGALADARLSALKAYAEREGITPSSHAAEALVLRMGLAGDFLDGPGIADADWNDMMEAIARVRIVDDEEMVPLGDTGIRFDNQQFGELLEFAREMPW